MVSPLEPLGFPPLSAGVKTTKTTTTTLVFLESGVDLRDAVRGEKIRRVAAYPPTRTQTPR